MCLTPSPRTYDVGMRLNICAQTANTSQYVDRTFRGGSMDDFKLSVLTKQHPKYASLKQQFLTKFLKPIAGLKVERIFQVQVRCR